MNDFVQMHVFFVVTTIAVAVVGILFSVALFYIVRILRTVDSLSQAARDESTLIRADISELRTNVRNEGMKLKHFATFGKKFAAIFSDNKRITK